MATESDCNSSPRAVSPRKPTPSKYTRATVVAISEARKQRVISQLRLAEIGEIRRQITRLEDEVIEGSGENRFQIEREIASFQHELNVKLEAVAADLRAGVSVEDGPFYAGFRLVVR